VDAVEIAEVELVDLDAVDPGEDLLGVGPAPGRPVVASTSAAVCLPASRLRTAIVTSAPAPASARVVSTPMPE
jgi:hypothetical protein